MHRFGFSRAYTGPLSNLSMEELVEKGSELVRTSRAEHGDTFEQTLKSSQTQSSAYQRLVHRLGQRLPTSVVTIGGSMAMGVGCADPRIRPLNWKACSYGGRFTEWLAKEQTLPLGAHASTKWLRYDNRAEAAMTTSGVLPRLQSLILGEGYEAGHPISSGTTPPHLVLIDFSVNDRVIVSGGAGAPPTSPAMSLAASERIFAVTEAMLRHLLQLSPVPACFASLHIFLLFTYCLRVHRCLPCCSSKRRAHSARPHVRMHVRRRLMACQCCNTIAGWESNARWRVGEVDTLLNSLPSICNCMFTHRRCFRLPSPTVFTPAVSTQALPSTIPTRRGLVMRRLPPRSHAGGRSL